MRSRLRTTTEQRHGAKKEVSEQLFFREADIEAVYFAIEALILCDGVLSSEDSIITEG